MTRRHLLPAQAGPSPSPATTAGKSSTETQPAGAATRRGTMFIARRRVEQRVRRAGLDTGGPAERGDDRRFTVDLDPPRRLVVVLPPSLPEPEHRGLLVRDREELAVAAGGDEPPLRAGDRPGLHQQAGTGEHDVLRGAARCACRRGRGPCTRCRALPRPGSPTGASPTPSRRRRRTAARPRWARRRCRARSGSVSRTDRSTRGCAARRGSGGSGPCSRRRTTGRRR